MEFEFEKDAMKDKKPKKSLDTADYFAYNSLRWLYRAYHKELIERPEAAEIKKKIVADWQFQKSKLEFLDCDVRQLSGEIKKAHETYEAEPTLENAERLIAIMFNRKEKNLCGHHVINAQGDTPDAIPNVRTT